jgi:hypothetical protein
MMREAHPYEAAERRQTVATGASPWLRKKWDISAVGATDSADSFAPTGLAFQNHNPHGLAPVAKT